MARKSKTMSRGSGIGDLIVPALFIFGLYKGCDKTIEIIKDHDVETKATINLSPDLSKMANPLPVPDVFITKEKTKLEIEEEKLEKAEESLDDQVNELEEQLKLYEGAD